MDFKRLDTKTGATKGAFLHLQHPALGHLMYTGPGADEDGRLINLKADKTKVGFMVMGQESERVRERARRIQRERMNKKNDDLADDEAGMEFVITMITDIVGFSNEGKDMEFSEENVRAILSMSDSFIEQVLTFAQDRANFFKAG